ncbi:protein NO VEIN domain-containing protein [Rhodococcus pyridinivorans]|uniref:protein NO VEIN domain-containing protein n=1 Tax=Rhodococcus pyridinivorans TaxID=103816 RepID=UPI003AAF1046
MSHSEFGDITPTQYDSAYEWLCTTGLLEQPADTDLSASRIFEAAVLTGEPAWFRDADELVLSPDDLPEDALRAAGALGLDLETAFACVSHIWGKVDTAAREQAGHAGELALLELLQKNTTAEVVHVAAFSDGYGYDISVRNGNFEHHLEVKSTTRRGRITVFFSRNEYSTMMRDPSWRLVLVRLNLNMEITGLDEISRFWLKKHSPSDSSLNGRWESTRFSVSSDALQPGMPFASEYLTAQANPRVIELLTAS